MALLGERRRSLRQASLGALTHTAPQMEITALVGCLRGEGLIITAPAEAVGYRWVGVAGAAQPLPKESEVPQASCACQAFTLSPCSPPPVLLTPPPTSPRSGLQEGRRLALPLPAPFHRGGGMPKSCLILDSAGAGRWRPGRGKAGLAMLWVWEQ